MKNSRAILTLNAGSSSLKFGLYITEGKNFTCLIQGAISELTTDLKNQPVLELSGINTNQDQPHHNLPALTNHQQAITWLLDWLQKKYPDTPVSVAGHRVVHGGTEFIQAVKIDQQILQRLHQLTHLAPLHIPHNLSVIEALQKQQPNLPQVACFDTAFHHTMDWNEQHYALPHELFDKGVRRYGFHGLSYEYIASVLPEYLGKLADAKIIVAHLGHGASLCALHERHSIATTMGLTPLSGLPMATRPGDIDPGLTDWLIRNAELSLDEVNDIFNHQSGLLALSGISADMRVLLTDKSNAAQQAVSYFIHHTHRNIASLAATLGGLDALIFTAGIGENSAPIRQKICTQANWLGLELNEEANVSARTSTNKGTKISKDSSRVSIWCIPTNEEIMIARHTQELLTENKYREIQ